MLKNASVNYFKKLYQDEAIRIAENDQYDFFEINLNKITASLDLWMIKITF
ncbi:hypothetical protein LLG34_06610 [bacterium]|nr:hypothetical protein [bacterium]